MAGEAKKLLGTEYVMESAGSALSDGDFGACADATFTTTEVAGYPLAIFELDAGFSAAPTAGAVINVYEQRFNADGNQAPTPDASNRNVYIGSFLPDLATATQYLTFEAPIHYFGADYYIEWVDGGAGTASLSANWVFRVTPFTYQPAS